MAGPDAAVLARLLSSSELRRVLARDVAAVTVELGLLPTAEQQLRNLDLAALEVQAQGLIAKRRHTVARLVPATWRLLGCEARGLFDAFAETCWPSGHQHHQSDALRFMQWLRAHGHPVHPLELARLATKLTPGLQRLRLRVMLLQRRPVLYVAVHTPRGWQERLLHFGPAPLLNSQPPCRSAKPASSG